MDNRENVCDLPQYLTGAQVAGMGIVGLQTLVNWRCQRKGPPFVRIGKKKVVYERSRLLAWLDAHTVETSRETI